MVAGDLPPLFESLVLDIIDPSGKVLDDVARYPLQLLLRPLAQLYPDRSYRAYDTPVR
jgi:hypothetical protein